MNKPDASYRPGRTRFPGRMIILAPAFRTADRAA